MGERIVSEEEKGRISMRDSTFVKVLCRYLQKKQKRTKFVAFRPFLFHFMRLALLRRRYRVFAKAVLEASYP